jgi:hypothetical protein
MTYALVAVQDPEPNQDRDADQRWMTFLGASASTLKKAKASEILAQNLWLLDLNSDMQILSLLISQAERHGFPCRTLFFEQKPLFCLS